MRWLRLFRETVTRLCTPEIAEIFIERSERIGNSFRMNIAMRRGNDITNMGPLKREPPAVWKPDNS
jgi:hemoglobin